VLCLGLLLPRPCGAQPSTGADMPAGAAPSALARGSAVTWTVSVDATRAPEIVAGDSLVLLSGPGAPVLALDATTGEERWTAGLEAIGRPAITRDHIFVQTETAIVALASDSGREVWSHAGRPPSAAPVIAGDALFALSGTELRAYRAPSGQGLWRIDFGLAVTAPVTVAGSAIVLAFEDGSLAALDAQTGVAQWRRAVGGTVRALTVANDLLAFTTTQGVCRVLRTADGTEAWHFDLRLAPVGAPAVDRERVYVALNDATIRALDRRSGNLRWLRPLEWRPFEGPRLADGQLLVPLANAGIATFTPSSGSPGREMPGSTAQAGVVPPALEAFALAPDASHAYLLTFNQVDRFVLTAVPLRPDEGPAAEP